MDAKVTWKYGLSFDGTGSSGFQLPLGTSIQSGGANDGFSPMELLLIGLAGCTAMDVISIMQKKRQDVTTFEVVVHGDRSTTDPKVYTDITIEYILTGRNLSREAAERSVELSESKYCSASAMLGKTAKISNKITLKEA